MKVILRLWSFFTGTPHIFFASFALVFGLFFIVIIPPFQTPDEGVHFMRAYQISELKLTTEKINGVSGDFLPRSINQTQQIVGTERIAFNFEEKYHLAQTKAALHLPLNPENQKFYDMSGTAVYTPVGYIPQAAAIFVGRVLKLPVVVDMYGARLANLLAWILLGVLLIRIAPIRKWALVAIGLMPMMLAQAASSSIDVISIGSIALFVALLVRYIVNKQVLGRNQYLILFGLASIMVLCKPTAIVVLPLVLLLRRPNFKNITHNRVFKLTMLGIPSMLLLAWVYITKDASQSPGQIANHQNTVEQIKYLLHEPWRWPVILFSTLFFTHIDYVWTSLIGKFGWLDAPVSELIVVIGFIYLAGVLLLEYKTKATKRLPNLSRNWMIVAAAAYALVVFGSLYLLYTPVGYTLVVGVQGRYLLPALFILALACPAFAAVSKQRYTRMVIFGSLFLGIVSLLTIYFRYYIIYYGLPLV